MSGLSNMFRTGVAMTFPQSLRRECTVDGRLVRLSPMESALLTVLLMSHPNVPVTRETIVEALWPDPDVLPLEHARCIFVYVWQLRRKGVAIDSARPVSWSIPRWARSADAVPQRMAA